MSEPFDLDHFLRIPRLSGLQASRDGTRLAVSVGALDADGKAFKTAIWGIDPSGSTPPRRLTRSAAGESGAAFLPDGSILFTSARPDPDAKAEEAGKDKPPAGLWLLPADGGEARLLLAPEGGVSELAVARLSGDLVIGAPLHPRADDFAADEAAEKARKDAGTNALLFERFPIRYWDHYLGPRDLRLFTADAPTAVTETLAAPRDLTGSTQEALAEPQLDIADDGRFVVVAWQRSTLPVRQDLVVFDRASGERRELTNGDAFYDGPAISPDGRSVACLRTEFGSPERAESARLWHIDVASGEGRRIGASLDLWPASVTWARDGVALFVLADRQGATSVFRLDLASDTVTLLAADGSYADLCPTPDGSTLFALCSRLDRPPFVARLDARAADQSAVEIPSPVVEADLPRRGVVERLITTADDGVEIGAWLIRPKSASAKAPAPLVTFVHGGPLGSWTGWHWRWNAHILVERGFAVLMPDPAFSTGYGQRMIDRGWGAWHERPYTDLMAALDAALTRPDLDAERTALMGGSFGGYMANWVAGHTARFKAIVTHASLWDLRGFHGVTDFGPWWEQEFGDPYDDPSRYVEQSPSASVAHIRTPMLVIHGELDHRVPIGEALRLWTDLWRHGVEAKFLYFPDENHWVLKPGNVRAWYGTVLAFLEQHVLGKDWVRPELL
ncbi:MAG: S9 family peptidase [Candidatus Limnocylindrales bacterium]